MIDKLFTFSECDETDQLVIVYERVQLLCSIGKFAPGDKFLYAYVDLHKGILILGKDTLEWKFSLSLQIGHSTQEPAQ